MNSIIKHFPGTACYFDNILIAYETKEHTFLQNLKHNNLHISLDK